MNKSFLLLSGDCERAARVENSSLHFQLEKCQGKKRSMLEKTQYSQALILELQCINQSSVLVQSLYTTDCTPMKQFLVPETTFCFKIIGLVFYFFFLF